MTSTKIAIQEISMTTINATCGDDLQHILDTVPTPATIYLAAGVYDQKIKISRSDITIIGAGAQSTVITHGDYARKIHSDGMQYTTFRTYTVCVTGENVRLENFAIVNSNTDPVKAGQCVALSVNAKAFSAEGMRLVSTQDTLFLAPFPDDLVVRYAGITDEGYYDGFMPRDELFMEGGALHCFKNCEICGTVDFIFGCAEAYFEKCRIVSLHDGRSTAYIAAPAHSLKQERGFCFYDCDLVSDGAEEGSVYLARPWRDFGMSVFTGCRAGKHIAPELFDRWNDTYRYKTARFYYGGMDFACAPSPVDWCHELDEGGQERYKALCRQAMAKFGL